MTLEWPQITWIILTTMRLTVTAFKEGQPKEGAWSTTNALIYTAISYTLLICGGFFR